MKLTTNCYPTGRYKDWEGRTVPFWGHDAKVVSVKKVEGVPVMTLEIPDQASREIEEGPDLLTSEMALDGVRAWVTRGGPAEDQVIKTDDGEEHHFERCDFCGRTKVHVDVTPEGEIRVGERQCCSHDELYRSMRG